MRKNNQKDYSSQKNWILNWKRSNALRKSPKSLSAIMLEESFVSKSFIFSQRNKCSAPKRDVPELFSSILNFFEDCSLFHNLFPLFTIILYKISWWCTNVLCHETLQDFVHNYSSPQRLVRSSHTYLILQLNALKMLLSTSLIYFRFPVSHLSWITL